MILFVFGDCKLASMTYELLKVWQSREHCVPYFFNYSIFKLSISRRLLLFIVTVIKVNRNWIETECWKPVELLLRVILHILKSSNILMYPSWVIRYLF